MERDFVAVRVMAVIPRRCQRRCALGKGAYDKVSEHQEYLEMCALCMSGDISDEQLRKLDGHLEGCLDCRRAFNEFRVIESVGMAALSPGLTRESIGEIEPMTERTARRLLAQIEDRIHSQRVGSEADALLRAFVSSPGSRTWVKLLLAWRVFSCRMRRCFSLRPS